MLLEALGAARDIGRLHEIASVLIRHGLGDVVRRTGIAGLLHRAGRVLHMDVAGQLVEKEPQTRLREALEELGPTFVKVGQILAGRSDLLPPEWIEELSRLREDARPLPFETLLPQLEEDLGKPPEAAFAHFDPEPLAAASIAQVHRARTEEGAEVVAKIRRPGIREVVEADLRLIQRLAELVEAEIAELRRFRPRSLARQFAHTLRDELDFRIEARNAQRMAQNLADDSDLVIPGVHEAFTGERLVVLDYLEGPSLAEWIEAGEFGPVDPRRIAAAGADACLEMVFRDGFFHADPHPGNVVLLRDQRIGLLDFGMVGRLSEERRLEFLELLTATVSREEELIVDILLGWSMDGRADVETLRSDCQAFLDRYQDRPLKELDITRVLQDITTLLRENDLFLPPDVALLFKVFVTLDDLGRVLDPDFNLTRRVEPFARRAWAEQRSPAAMARRGARGLRRLFATLPRDLRRLAQELRRGRVRVELEIDELDRFTVQLDRSVNRLTIGLIIAALIVGTSIALSAQSSGDGIPYFALFGFVASSTLGLWLLWSIWRSGRPPRRH